MAAIPYSAGCIFSRRPGLGAHEAGLSFELDVRQPTPPLPRGVARDAEEPEARRRQGPSVMRPVAYETWVCSRADRDAAEAAAAAKSAAAANQTDQ
jgi:hypothetical protein